MAEETIDVPPTSEKIVLDGGHTRRNSTGNLSISKSEVKVLPRYLSASMSSCHDFCKYGIKHILEKNPRNSARKRIPTRSGEDRHQSEDENSEVKKKSVTNPKPLVDSKCRTTKEHQVVEKKIPVSAKKMVVSTKPFFFSHRDRVNVSANHASDSRPKPVQTKSSSFSTPRRLSSRRYSEILPHKETGGLQWSPVGGSSGRRHSDASTTREMRTSKLRKKNNLLPPTVSSFPRSSIGRELTAESGHLKDPKQASPLKSQKTQNSARKSVPKKTIDKVPETTLFIVETMPENSIVGVTQNGDGTTHFSQHPSQKTQNGARRSKPKKTIDKVPETKLYVFETKPENSIVGVTQNDGGTTHFSQYPSQSFKKYCQHGTHTSQSPPFTASKKLRHTRNGIQITQSSSSSSLVFEKKSLRHIKNWNRGAVSASSSLSLLSSSSSASESMKSDGSDPISEGNGTRTKQMSNHKVERTNQPRRVVSEGKVGSPRKLNFTSGKVVDVQSKNSSPRRLRFKQIRVLGENQNGKADTKLRSLKEVVAISNLNGSESKPTNVVLRHQDVEGKKVGQSLLNNVIEETASKLVQTRKSKVKALVGAFETVISLQDTKSLATISAS